jgi:hypothetical protein
MTTAVLPSFTTVRPGQGHWRRPFLRRNGPKPRRAASGRPQRHNERKKIDKPILVDLTVFFRPKTASGPFSRPAEKAF